MPKFLEAKLKRQYPGNPHAVYGTLNAIGAMHGAKETAKGRAMTAKHHRDVGMRSHGHTEHSHQGNPGRKPIMRHGNG